MREFTRTREKNSPDKIWLLDLQRRKIGLNQLINIIEQSVIALLTLSGTYHGLSLKLDMDFTPSHASIPAAMPT